MGAVLVYVTTADREEAERIGIALVEERLAACVNILDGMTSIYRWKGVVERAREAVLLVKTAADRAPATTERIRQLHSYETPCVITLSIAGGNADYLDWIDRESAPHP